MRPLAQNGMVKKWIISVVSICKSKQGIILLTRCPVKVSVEGNRRDPSITRSNIDAKPDR